jgi:hypothetical protein
MAAHKGMVAAFLAESALISWRDLHNDKILPPPSDYVGAAISFGILGLAPDAWGPLTAVMGWGLVLATFLNLWNNQTPLNLTTKAAQPGGAASTTNEGG